MKQFEISLCRVPSPPHCPFHCADKARTAAVASGENLVGAFVESVDSQVSKVRHAAAALYIQPIRCFAISMGK